MKPITDLKQAHKCEYAVIKGLGHAAKIFFFKSTEDIEKFLKDRARIFYPENLLILKYTVLPFEVNINIHVKVEEVS